jgi:hypothetical protein
MARGWQHILLLVRIATRHAATGCATCQVAGYAEGLAHLNSFRPSRSLNCMTSSARVGSRFSYSRRSALQNHTRHRRVCKVPRAQARKACCTSIIWPCPVLSSRSTPCGAVSERVKASACWFQCSGRPHLSTACWSALLVRTAPFGKAALLHNQALVLRKVHLEIVPHPLQHAPKIARLVCHVLTDALESIRTHHNLRQQQDSIKAASARASSTPYSAHCNSCWYEWFIKYYDANCPALARQHLRRACAT